MLLSTPGTVASVPTQGVPVLGLGAPPNPMGSSLSCSPLKVSSSWVVLVLLMMMTTPVLYGARLAALMPSATEGWMRTGSPLPWPANSVAWSWLRAVLMLRREMCITKSQVGKP